MDPTALVFLYQEKRRLYQELIEVLRSEKNWIILAKAEGLWQASDRKQRIVADIEAIRERILDTLAESGIGHDMTQADFRSSRIIHIVPAAVRKALMPIHNDLLLVKEEIAQRARENAFFVEECLTTLNDLIGVFTRGGGSLYDRARHVDYTASHTLVHREV